MVGAFLSCGLLWRGHKINIVHCVCLGDQGWERGDRILIVEGIYSDLRRGSCDRGSCRWCVLSRVLQFGNPRIVFFKEIKENAFKDFRTPQKASLIFLTNDKCSMKVKYRIRGGSMKLFGRRHMQRSISFFQFKSARSNYSVCEYE